MYTRNILSSFTWEIMAIIFQTSMFIFFVILTMFRPFYSPLLSVIEKNSWPNKLKCWLKPIYFNSSIHRLIEKRQPVGITSLRDILKIVVDGEKKNIQENFQLLDEGLWLLYSLYFDTACSSLLSSQCFGCFTFQLLQVSKRLMNECSVCWNIYNS